MEYAGRRWPLIIGGLWYVVGITMLSSTLKVTRAGNRSGYSCSQAWASPVRLAKAHTLGTAPKCMHLSQPIRPPRPPAVSSSPRHRCSSSATLPPGVRYARELCYQLCEQSLTKTLRSQGIWILIGETWAAPHSSLPVNELISLRLQIPVQDPCQAGRSGDGEQVRPLRALRRRARR